MTDSIFRWWVVIFLSIITGILIGGTAHAYNNGGSYEDRLERPTYHPKYECKTRDCGESVEVDRHVLNKIDYEKDPTVHVAASFKNIPVEVITAQPQVITKYVTEKPTDVVVTTTWCDDEKEDCK